MEIPHREWLEELGRNGKPGTRKKERLPPPIEHHPSVSTPDSHRDFIE